MLGILASSLFTATRTQIHPHPLNTRYTAKRDSDARRAPVRDPKQETLS